MDESQSGLGTRLAISIFIIRNASLVTVARIPNSVAKCTKLLAEIPPPSEIDLTALHNGTL